MDFWISFPTVTAFELQYRYIINSCVKCVCVENATLNTLFFYTVINNNINIPILSRLLQLQNKTLNIDNVNNRM